jgi:non-lysosomal glucosylceramidase
MDDWSELSSYKGHLQWGHHSPGTNGSTRSGYPWQAKQGSHDDGELAGLFLGGIGAPVVSRDLDGRFARWHLQPGFHLRQIITEAFFGLRWSSRKSGVGGYFRLNGAGRDGAGSRGPLREVYSLFPVTREVYTGEDIPFEAILELYTPLLSGTPAFWPVWYATITVQNSSLEDLSIDTTCFWPNFLGWRLQLMTSLDRSGRSWPGQTHAGNTGVYYPEDVLVLQQRHPDRPVTGDMEGEIALIATGRPGDRTSGEGCFKITGNAIDRPPEKQGHTLPWVESVFSRTGSLPETGLSWTAHWDEALGSAVHRGFDLAPGKCRAVTYTFAFDMPIVTFGNGRRWFRKYTGRFGTTGRNSRTIATLAASLAGDHRRDIADVHRSFVTDREGGAMINELYFVNGGGSVWVDRWARELDTTMPPPLLDSGEHAALLEGYDVGYYYYNTTDLWPYAWPGLRRWWPEFTEVIFRDLLKSIPVGSTEHRVYYRTETYAPLLVPGKLPHDVGSVMEDPWHRLNGYQMRDDSNLWKDHNPGFLISFYLYRQYSNPEAAGLSGSTVSAEEWSILRRAGEFLLAQDTDADGLPLHDEFGDSTWDNLGIRGVSAYSGGMNLAALAALTDWAEQKGDVDFARECRNRIHRGGEEYLRRLWNGEYFRLCDEGAHRDSIMADGLIGFYLAHLAGLSRLIAVAEADKITSHLQSVYRYNFLQYREGQVGPLLVAAPGKTAFPGDGGDELQVNEVLVGSAWMTVAMMRRFGLNSQADHISTSLIRALYGDGTGGSLQFRTPAALDGNGRFRAPMNMRPLSIWFLYENRLRQPGGSTQ